MSGRRIKGYKYMVIKNQTKMKKEHIQAVMRAANFDNDRYKKFKLMYNFFGLLFGMMFVRYLIFEMLGSSERDRKSTRLNSSHPPESRMPSSA